MKSDIKLKIAKILNKHIIQTEWIEPSKRRAVDEIFDAVCLEWTPFKKWMPEAHESILATNGKEVCYNGANDVLTMKDATHWISVSELLEYLPELPGAGNGRPKITTR